MAFENFEIYLKRKMKRILLKPYYMWPAYEMGIINDKGEKIREPKTADEKFRYNVFDELLRRIRVLFDKYVPSAGTKRFKVFKSFINDGFIETIEEEYNIMCNQGVVTEDIEYSLDHLIINWIKDNDYDQ